MYTPNFPNWHYRQVLRSRSLRLDLVSNLSRFIQMTPKVSTLPTFPDISGIFFFSHPPNREKFQEHGQKNVFAKSSFLLYLMLLCKTQLRRPPSLRRGQMQPPALSLYPDMGSIPLLSRGQYTTYHNSNHFPEMKPDQLPQRTHLSLTIIIIFFVFSPISFVVAYPNGPRLINHTPPTHPTSI